MVVRFGLVGCGAMGRELGEALKSCVAEAALLAAFDRYRPNMERLCADLGARPADSLEELLDSADVGAVIVASPNHLHRDQTVAAAAAGKHVFCEKPMALSLADCDDMIAACDRAGVRLMVGHSMRLYPLTKRLLEIAASGDLGAPRFAFASYFFSGFRERDSGIWHLDRANSGGLFFHMGIHHIDLLNAIMGQARRVQYAGGRYGQQVHDFDDVASITVEYESGVTLRQAQGRPAGAMGHPERSRGATALLTTSSISPVNWREFAFLFEQGFARLDSPWTYLEYGQAEDRMKRVEPADLPPENVVATELRSFARWVLHDEPPVFTAKEGRAAVAVAEAAQRARDTGAATDVKP
jgi:myo-inositol 2-dehydrogenase/D-chiro-inositol 1-dehydrogenase